VIFWVTSIWGSCNTG